MDFMAHLILTILIFGWDLTAIIGGTLPDFLYLIAFLYARDKNCKKTKIFIWGERLHSFFIIPPLGFLLYLISQNYSFITFTNAVLLHLICDVITHRTEGPRFLWPFFDKYYPHGLVDWNKPKVMISYYAILSILVLFKIYL